jgi:hypothetical protein
MGVSEWSEWKGIEGNGKEWKGMEGNEKKGKRKTILFTHKKRSI